MQPCGPGPQGTHVSTVPVCEKVIYFSTLSLVIVGTPVAVVRVIVGIHGVFEITSKISVLVLGVYMKLIMYNAE